jgi:hypothetical protein
VGAFTFRCLFLAQSAKKENPEEGFQHKNSGNCPTGRLGSRWGQQVKKDTMQKEGRNCG